MDSTTTSDPESSDSDTTDTDSTDTNTTDSQSLAPSVPTAQLVSPPENIGDRLPERATVIEWFLGQFNLGK